MTTALTVVEPTSMPTTMESPVRRVRGLGEFPGALPTISSFERRSFCQGPRIRVQHCCSLFLGNFDAAFIRNDVQEFSKNTSPYLIVLVTGKG
jgi:hypothetical protein